MLNLRLRKLLDAHKSSDLAKIHHMLMEYYGTWIPIEEFRKIPIPTLVNLITFIQESQRASVAYASKLRKVR